MRIEVHHRVELAAYYILFEVPESRGPARRMYLCVDDSITLVSTHTGWVTFFLVMEEIERAVREEIRTIAEAFDEATKGMEGPDPSYRPYKP